MFAALTGASGSVDSLALVETREQDNKTGARGGRPEVRAQAGQSQQTRYRTVVDTKKIRDGLDAQRRVDAQTPGFATAIEVESLAGAQPSDGVDEVLDRSVGTTSRSTGGLGQFSSISIRGSSPQQVEILSDGIPLGDSFVGAVDLADLSLTPLSSIEIYRGYIPVAMGVSAIGGVINLVSRPSENRSAGKLRMRGEAGSFGTRATQVSMSYPLGRTTGLTTDLAYGGSSGEYIFFNDHATPLTTADDSFDYRQQNGYDRGLVRLRVDHRAGDWRLMTQGLGMYKYQGIPGPAGATLPPTSLQTGLGKLMFAAVRRRLKTGGHLRWLASVGYADRQLSVRPQVAGLVDRREHTRVVDTYVSPRLRLPLWRSAFVHLAADLRSEWIAIDNLSGQPAVVTGQLDRSRHRVGTGIELEQFVFQRRLRIVPALRVEALRSRFPAGDGGDQLATPQRLRTDVAASPRLGMRLSVASGIDLRASLARYFRPPTVLELFGNRGAIVGNESLLPEQGTTVDAGLTLDRAFATSHRVYAQFAGFARHSRDTIAMLPTGTAVRAFNLEGTRVHGLESTVWLSLWSRHAEFTGNYTLMPTRNLRASATGGSLPLPGRPRHQLFVRLSSGHRWDLRGGTVLEPRIAYTLDYLDAMYLDPSGRVAIAPRVIHGASIVVRIDERMRMAVEGRNLGNRITTTWDASAYDNAGAVTTPVVDYLRYPLPGLSVMMTMTFDLDLPTHRRREHVSTLF